MMNNFEDSMMTEDENETLREVMNTAFGSAAADLSGVIDLFVTLSVPKIQVLRVESLSGFFKDEIKSCERVSIIEQNYWSRFRGVALLVFPSGVGKVLVALLGNVWDPTSALEHIDALEKEVLMETGNILVRACVSKIAELLGDVVMYSPPRVLMEDLSKNTISRKIFEPDSLSVTLRTVFHLGGQEIRGLLFLIFSQESINLLKGALAEFMKQYK